MSGPPLPIPPTDRPAAGDDPRADETTGLPGLRSWRAVYLFVIASFVAYVVLLLALPRVFR